jgi:hypothetical protein
MKTATSVCSAMTAIADIAKDTPNILILLSWNPSL